MQYVIVASLDMSNKYTKEQIWNNNYTILDAISDANNELINHFCLLETKNYKLDIKDNNFGKYNNIYPFKSIYKRHMIKNLLRSTAPYKIWKFLRTIKRKLYNNYCFSKYKTEKDAYIQQILDISRSNRSDFVQFSSQVSILIDKIPKLIAFYLPQFHPFAENDSWWGKGFTEWSNVTKAVPQFINHYQPRLPIDIGFYDLRLPEILQRQVELATNYGINGFCFHYYWFSGKRLMTKPIDNFYLDKSLNLNFCFCWANESWSRRWDGSEGQLLIKQELKDNDDENFILDLLDYFNDNRYIYIDGKPLLIIYRPHLWPKKRVKILIEKMNETAVKNGFNGLYLVMALTYDFSENPISWGFDAAVDFPPHLSNKPNKSNVELMNRNFDGNIFDMKSFVNNHISKKYSYPIFRTVVPSWDNTARKIDHATIFHNSSPSLDKFWLLNALNYTYNNKNKTNYVFINAWNEWAESAYLEPDRKFGYAYLQATYDALLEFSNSIV
jgi:lipopolysaccharide biosynthesis protein